MTKKLSNLSPLAQGTAWALSEIFPFICLNTPSGFLSLAFSAPSLLRSENARLPTILHHRLKYADGPPFFPAHRIFLAEARVCLARIVYAFDIQLAMPDEWDWPDQKAYLTHEPKSVWVKLVERL